MHLSSEAKLVSGITLFTNPTAMYRGWTMIGLLTGGWLLYLGGLSPAIAVIHFGIGLLRNLRAGAKST